MWGGAITVGLLIVSLILSAQKQCPDSYTQQHVDASHCIVGANIGLGLAIMACLAAAAITVIALVIAMIIEHKRR
jgi:hypothetical protein